MKTHFSGNGYGEDNNFAIPGIDARAAVPAAENRRANSERGGFGLIVSIRHPHNANDGNKDSLLRPRRAGEPETEVIASSTNIISKAPR